MHRSLGASGLNHPYRGAACDAIMNRSMLLPKEIEFRGIYLSPLLLSVALAVAATWLTSKLLVRYGLAHRFEQPLLAYLSIATIYTIIISSLIIPS
jgi:hypothetical protein